MTTHLKRAWSWAIEAEGSTRLLALLRIGLAMLLWDRWAGEFLLFRLTGAENLAIGFSFYVSTTLVLFGLFTRLSSAWLAVTMLAVFYRMGIARGIESYTHHHTFLLVSFAAIMALTPSGRSLSLDRWFAVRRAEKRGEAPPPEIGPLWGQRLVALQVSALYFWATWDKCSLAFFSGSRMQHIILSRYGTSDPIGIPYFEPLMQLCAISTVVIEGALALLLWVPRLRVPMLIVGILFHGMLYVLLPVGPFSATIVLMYLAFFDPKVVHDATERLLGRSPPAQAPSLT